MIGRKGADPKVSRAFYITVTQTVLLFGSETWILTPRMEKALDSFHSRFAKNITRIQPRQRKYGSWIYLPKAGLMKETEMVVIHASITRRQNTVAQSIVTRLILDLCEQDTQQLGTQVSWWWW